MDVVSPSFPPNHSDYDLACQVALDLPVQDVIDRAVLAGWRTEDVLSALEEVAKSKAVAYQHDPDPEDEATDEAVDPTTPAFSGFSVD
ncbi:hypothetical protein [Rhizobium sp. NFR03]|uniref:hypothetical protein n=1 Tax=Rhizobium sp. NFR03 TaxID=1566263 RepID=UPI0008D4E008|nr:hypothetical protein [Rhizobium sp. NFR03]SES47428.1 hypothetical protein SAMN03159406_04996 [Rhizobium sp. NFR03]